MSLRGAPEAVAAATNKEWLRQAALNLFLIALSVRPGSALVI